MTDKASQTEGDFLSPEEVQRWLAQEILDSTKAFELRIREAKALAASYSAGNISPEEAKKQLIAYDRRWGEALYGASAGSGLSDERIVEAVDRAREEQFTQALHRRKLTKGIAVPPTGRYLL